MSVYRTIGPLVNFVVKLTIMHISAQKSGDLVIKLNSLRGNVSKIIIVYNFRHTRTQKQKHSTMMFISGLANTAHRYSESKNTGTDSITC